MWLLCHPSPNWTWILILDWFGFGFRSKLTSPRQYNMSKCDLIVKHSVTSFNINLYPQTPLSTYMCMCVTDTINNDISLILIILSHLLMDPESLPIFARHEHIAKAISTQ